MGASKQLLASVAIFLVLIGVWADAGPYEKAFVVEQGASPYVLKKQELEQLRARIDALESTLVDRTSELKSKDESIEHLGKTIEEKSATLASLQSEIESVQNNKPVDGEELVKKAYARASDLEKQVEKLRNEVELQKERRGDLDTQAREAETKMQELNSKLQNLRKANDEQKHRIQKMERALQVAKEELMRTQLETTAKSKVLFLVRGAWLPPWLATHINHYQDVAAAYWKDQAKPALAVLLQKAKNLVGPHLEISRTKWIPSIKKKWLILLTRAQPYVQTVLIKTAEVYHTSKNTISRHAVRLQKLAEPYFKVARKFSKPYFDQVTTITKPYVKKLKVASRPYTKRVVRSYRKLLKIITTYHRQAQTIIHKHLKKYELTKPLATKELAWYMACSFLALPVILVCRLLIDIFGSGRSRKTAPKNARGNHTHRRPKRRHADK